jgi:hypothetical protein
MELEINPNNSYDGFGGVHQISGIGVHRWNEHDADANWTGDVYVDDISLIGAYPTVVGDFEDGVGSFLNTGWGSGFVDMSSDADPASGATDKALRVGFNGANGGSARIYWENGITRGYRSDYVCYSIYRPRADT